MQWQPLTKLQNPTVFGLHVPASTQWSQPSRFCHWSPSFGANDYSPPKSTTHKTNHFFPHSKFYLLPTGPRLTKKYLKQFGNSGNWSTGDLGQMTVKNHDIFQENWNQSSLDNKMCQFFMFLYRISTAEPFFKSFRFAIFCTFHPQPCIYSSFQYSFKRILVNLVMHLQTGYYLNS